MKVSVITPCYNSVRFVKRTIESVRRQTWTDWEQIVVDDGSADGSAAAIEALLEEEPRLHLVCKPNGGVASARNAGFRASCPQSDYLLFLDADDCLEPNMLAKMVGVMEAHPDLGLVYCDHTYIDADDRPIATDRRRMGWTPRYVPRGFGVGELPPSVPETPFVAVFSLATILPSFCLMRRATYERTPGWDEAFGQHYEDTNLILHMAVRAGVYYLDLPLVRHRRHEGQSTADVSRYAGQERKLYAQWRDRADLTPSQQALVRAAFRFREGRLLPYLGMKAARRHLGQGQIGPALRFVLGAGKRYLRSLLPMPK